MSPDEHFSFFDLQTARKKEHIS